MNDKAKTFVNQLFMMVKTAQIHSPENRAFQNPLETLLETLTELIAEEGNISLENIDVHLYINENKIRTDISTFGTFRYLQELFEAKNVAGLRFHKVPSKEELTSFMKLFARLTETEVSGAEPLNDWLAEREILSVELIEKTERTTATKKDRSKAVTQKRQALKNYVKTMDVIKMGVGKKQTAGSLKQQARKAKRLVYNLVDICLEEGFSFFGLSNIKNYDEYTFNHSVNVCIVSIGFGKNLGLSKKQIGELGIAGLYHDYGKLMIPREILNKPGKFDPDEWEIMKRHPMESIKSLLDMQSFQDIDIKKMIAAFEHHRNYDQSGYPQTGIDKPMNFYSRVVAIADAYDAMTTNRVYQRAMLPTVALKILSDNAGTKFDPLLTKAFVNTVGIYPVGTLVRLQKGDLGVVTSVHKDPDRIAHPKIRIVADAFGSRIQKGPEVDLFEVRESSEMAINTVLHPEDYGINVAHYLFADVADELKNSANQA